MSILCKLGFHKYEYQGIKRYYGWFHDFIYDKYKCNRCGHQTERCR